MNAEYFNRKLLGLNIATPFVAANNTHIYHQYILRLNYSSVKLSQYLRKKGIDSRVYYPLPLHLQKCFADLGYKPGDMPVSEAAANETLALPIYPELTDIQAATVVESIKVFYESR